MSGVSSDFRYFQDTIADYQRAAREAEEEHRREKTESKKRNEEEIQSIRDKNEEQRVRQAESHQDVITDLKKVTHQTLENQKESYDRVLEDQKRDTYDRFGRIQGELKEAQRNSDNAIKTIEEEHRKDRRALSSESDDYVNRRIEEIQKNHRKELEEVAERSRDSAQEAYHEKAKETREGENSEKERLTKKYEELSREKNLEVNADRKRALQAIEDVERESGGRIRKIELDYERKNKDLKEQFEAKSQEGIFNMQRKHREENQDLRKENAMLMNRDQDIQKDRAIARQQAIDEIHGDAQSLLNRVERAHGEELSKAKRDLAETEVRFGNQNAENITELGRSFTKRLHEKNEEDRFEKKQLEKSYQKNVDDLQAQHLRDRERFEKNLDLQVQQSTEARNKALENQADSYRQTLQNKQENFDTQMAILQSENQNAKTTSDPTVFSPAAEESLRKLYVGEYGKVFKEEQERNRRDIDQFREGQKDRVDDLQHNYNVAKREFQHEATDSRNLDRTQFLRFAEESELNRRESLQTQEHQHDKQVNAMEKNQERAVRGQQQKYDELLLDQSLDNQNRIRSMEQDSDFKERMHRMQSNSDQRRLIRQFEKKMSDQKESYENLLQESRLEAERRIQESQRESRFALDDQKRNYEHRITQLELQQKERERILTENYEDQLDKMKQTNARIIQKKS